MQSVKKARRAGALYGGREPSRWKRKTLRFSAFTIARSSKSKNERGMKEERHFFQGSNGGRSPRGPNAQESRRFRPELILCGAKRNTAPWGGESR